MHQRFDANTLLQDVYTQAANFAARYPKTEQYQEGEAFHQDVANLPV
jgi:hypothetical protein